MTSAGLGFRAPASESARAERVSHVLRPVGRFALHLFDMCVVMCAGAFVLSVLFFGAAALLGYTDLPETAPELSVFVIALNLSVPILVGLRLYSGSHSAHSASESPS